MSNQQASPNMMASRGNTKRDSTRILSNLSSNSRVVPARAKSASSRNKILVLLTVLLALLVLVGATIWYMQRPKIPATTPSLATTAATTTHADVPTQTAPDATALALSTLAEPQAAQIENVPTTDDINEKGVTSEITTPAQPFAALTEDTTQSEKTNNAKPVEKMVQADQKTIAKNTTKKVTPASRSRKAEDDTDVTLLAALIQSTEASASAKKTVPKKTPSVAERLKSCQQLEKEKAARCSQKVCEGKAGKNAACQKLSAKK